jgi:hypothetical protein
MSEPRIVKVEAFDGDCFGITLSSGHTILLELGDRVREPTFAALIERGVFDKPQTDGERIFWQGDLAFTVTEILAMVAQSGGKPQASAYKNKGDSTMEKKKARILTICGAVAAVLSAVVIVIGIIDMIERSQYQNVVANTPVVVVLGLVFIAGVAAFVIGLKKLKAKVQ